MPASSPWDVISGAGSSRTVLTIDFPDDRRREAGFTELATRIGPGYRFLRAKPPAVRLGRQSSRDAYIGYWIKDLRQGRHQALAVLGYWIGGIYAAAIVEEISRWQQPPKLILFDPQAANMQLLSHEFHRDIAANSSILSDDEIQRARKLADEITESEPEGIADVAAETLDMYLDLITVAFERAGLGSARGNKLLTPFEACISWVSAAGEIDPGRSWRRSGAILSSDYPELPGKGLPAECATDNIWFGVKHADLLRSDSVAQTVADLLRSQ